MPFYNLTYFHTEELFHKYIYSFMRGKMTLMP